jgi:hypothetical protein
LTTRVLAAFRHSPIGEHEFKKFGIEAADSMVGAAFQLNVIVDGDRAPTAQIDGEEWIGGGQYRIEVKPRALRLIVPRESDL